LYFTNGGSVGLDLRQAPGRFDIRWIEIATGEWSQRSSIDGGAVVAIDAPGPGNWVAAIVRATP
ncbi:MAG: hypothetical protein MUF25_15165, partial [Pirellulaceae bacterium]|nr:hypothetical protein [Pirellulaceae bacterium]